MRDQTVLSIYCYIYFWLGFGNQRSMHILTLLAVSVGLCWSAPTPDRVVHEKRLTTPMGWTKRARLSGDLLLPLRIGLSQQNLERGPEILYNVSDPTSMSYGSYFSAQQVTEMFRPRYSYSIRINDSRQRSVVLRCRILS